MNHKSKGPRAAATRPQVSVDTDPVTTGFDDVDEHEESDRREVFSARQAISLGNGGYRTLPQYND